MAAKSNARSLEKQSFISRVFGDHNSRITSKSDYHTVSQRRAWSPGLQRSPWMALLAIFLTVAAIATCIGILVGSDGKPVNRWTFQPTVYLAIATTVANICLHFAFAEGVTIVWWRKALGATTVGELHRAYDHGRDFWAALSAYRHVNFVAIACLMVTVSPINGPLSLSNYHRWIIVSTSKPGIAHSRRDSSWLYSLYLWATTVCIIPSERLHSCRPGMEHPITHPPQKRLQRHLYGCRPWRWIQCQLHPIDSLL